MCFTISKKASLLSGPEEIVVVDIKAPSSRAGGLCSRKPRACGVLFFSCEGFEVDVERVVPRLVLSPLRVSGRSEPEAMGSCEYRRSSGNPSGTRGQLYLVDYVPLGRPLVPPRLPDPPRSGSKTARSVMYKRLAARSEAR